MPIGLHQVIGGDKAAADLLGPARIQGTGGLGPSEALGQAPAGPKSPPASWASYSRSRESGNPGPGMLRSTRRQTPLSPCRPGLRADRALEFMCLIHNSSFDTISFLTTGLIVPFG